jgi:hypothetical protein
MTSDSAVAGPGRRILEHADQLQEDHLICQPEVYQDELQPTRTDAAVQGFQGFLATFTAHVSAPKRFMTEAYAAAWVMHPGAFDGMRGQDVAKLIGVPRETFSRSVAGWAAKTGIRPEGATRAFKAHRKAKGV